MKIVYEFFIILVIIGLIFAFAQPMIGFIAHSKKGVRQVGFPLFYEIGSVGPMPNGEKPPSIFYPWKLIIDILIWISISAGITYYGYKRRNKNINSK